VSLVEGIHEGLGRDVLALEWFAALSAPNIPLIELDRSWARPHFDELGRFAKFMTGVVVTQTYPETT
jgi:hypothetical protein